MTTWKMAARQALLCGVCAVALSGCGTPLWPELKSDVKKVDGNVVGMDGEEAITNASLNDALKYAYVTLDELSTGNQNAGGLTRSTSYLATALGVGAGAAVLFAASEVVLKGLTLGGAALLGGYSVANPEGQRKIFSAGEDAIVCVIGTANAHRAAVANLNAAFYALGATSPAMQKQMTKAAGAANVFTAQDAALSPARAAQAQQLAIAMRIAANLPPPLSLRTGADDSAAFQTAQKNVATYNALRQKTLDTLLTFATAYLDQPRQVVHSTWQIRAKVRQQLASTAPDPSTIIETRRDAIVAANADLVTKVRAAREAAKKAPDTGEGAGTGTPPAGNGVSALARIAPNAVGGAAVDTTEAIALMQLIAKIVADSLKPVEQAYQSCIDKATVAAQEAGEEGDE